MLIGRSANYAIHPRGDDGDQHEDCVSLCRVSHSGWAIQKEVENVLLILSSILRKAKAWDHACGSFSLADITLPREGVRKEQRCFTDEDVGKILAAKLEPFGTKTSSLTCKKGR